MQNFEFSRDAANNSKVHEKTNIGLVNEDTKCPGRVARVRIGVSLQKGSGLKWVYPIGGQARRVGGHEDVVLAAVDQWRLILHSQGAVVRLLCGIRV